MNLVNGLKSSSPIVRASLICVLALPLLGAGNDAAARYELVKIFDRNSTAPLGDRVEVAIHPQIVSAGNIAFIAHVHAGTGRAKEVLADSIVPPQASAGKAEQPLTERLGNPTSASAPFRSALDPDAASAAPAAAAPAAPAASPGVREFGRPIYRYVGGKVIAASVFRNVVDQSEGFAVNEKKTYYHAKNKLMVYENGKETLVSLASDEYPQLAGATPMLIDAEGDLFAFAITYPESTSPVSYLALEVFTLRAGRFKSVFKDRITEEIDGRPPRVSIGGGRVFIETTKGLYGSTDSGAELLIDFKKEVADRNLKWISYVSGSGDKVYFVGERDPEPGANTISHTIYRLQAGKIELFAAKNPFGADELSGFDSIAVGGDTAGSHTVAVVERLGEKNRRLVAHRGQERIVIATSGDKLFGQTLKYITVGPRAVDAAGNIAFTYELADGTAGIGLAKVR
jgi:hypothetical protein